MKIEIESETTPGFYAPPWGLTNHTFFLSENVEEYDLPDVNDWDGGRAAGDDRKVEALSRRVAGAICLCLGWFAKGAFIGFGFVAALAVLG